MKHSRLLLAVFLLLQATSLQPAMAQQEYPYPTPPSSEDKNNQGKEEYNPSPNKCESCDQPSCQYEPSSTTPSFELDLGTSSYPGTDSFVGEDWSMRKQPYTGHNVPTTDKPPFSGSLSGNMGKKKVRPVVIALAATHITDPATIVNAIQIYGDNGGGAWVKKNGAGVIEQILTDQYLASITTEGETTKITVYYRSAIGGMDGSGQYTVPTSKQAVRLELSVSRSFPTTKEKQQKVVLKDYSSSTTSPKVTSYQWTEQEEEKTLTLSQYNGEPDPLTPHTTSELVEGVTDNGLMQRTLTVKTADGVVTSIKREKYRNIGSEDLPILRIVEETEAVGTPDEFTTSYIYTDPTGTGTVGAAGIITAPTPGAVPNSLVGGRLYKLSRSDGYWEEYKYQYNGGTRIMITEKWSPWKNSLASEKGSSRHTTITLQDNSRTVIEEVAGQVVSSEHETLVIGSDGIRTMRNVVKTGTGAALVTENAYYPDTAPEPNTGRLQYTRHPDGTATRYTYSTETVPLNITLSAVRTVAEHGAINADQFDPSATGPVPPFDTEGAQGTRTVTLTSSFETNLGTEVYDIASGLLLSKSQVSEVDDIGRPKKIIHDDDLTHLETFEYACCGVKLHTARDGTVTDYYKDPTGRPDYTDVKVGTKTTRTGYAYGKEVVGVVELPKTTVTQSILIGTQLKESLVVSEIVTNLRGQTVISRVPTAAAATGLDTTTTEYDVATRTTTSTGPDEITLESTSYADGQSCTSISRAGATPVTPLTTIDYEPHNSNGGGIKTITQQSNGGTVLSSTVSFADLAGRTFRTESPGYNGATLVSTTGFDERGRAVTTSATGKPNSLRVLNLLGEVVEVWSDSNGDGNFANSAEGVIGDAWQKTVSDYFTEEGQICRRIRQWVRDDGNSLILVSTSYRSANGFYSKSVPLNGPVTVTTTDHPFSGNSSSETLSYLTPESHLTSITTTTLAANGETTTFTVNKDTSNAIVSTVTTVQDWLGRTVSRSDGRTPATIYSNFTASGMPLTISRGDDTYTVTILDSAGRPVTETTYQIEGLNTTVIATVHTSYHPDGKVAGNWGTNTNPTYKIYDIQGRLKELYTYRSVDLVFEPTATSPGPLARDSTVWNYEDATGLLLSKTDAASKGVSYTYTADGKLLTRAWARGITTTYGYDDAGRLISTNYSDSTPDVSFEYDRLGRRTKITNGLATSVFTYDPATLAPDLETITYDLNLDNTPELTRVIDRTEPDLGLPTGFELKNGSTVETEAVYTYSSTDGRLEKVKEGTKSFTYGYQPGSNLIQTVTGPVHTTINNWETSRDVLNLKENKNNKNGEESVMFSRYDYAVNGLGQRTGVATEGSQMSSQPSWAWGYDALGQVVRADHSDNDNDRAYEYDAIGNRKKSADSLTLPSTDNYETNNLNQYTKVGSISPTYDNDGNATAYPLPVASTVRNGLAWDAENRLLAAMDNEAPRGTYLYDGQSRRIAKTVGEVTTLFVYDGWNCIAEYSGTGFTLAKTRLWGLDLSGTIQGAGGVGGLLAETQGGNTYYPTYDGNGNISEYLDSAGAAVAHFEYDPFGNTVANSDSNNLFYYRFSTKPFDLETGLYYYGYRYYDPLTGRWPSRDPIREDGGVNLYGFVGNSPLIMADFLGLSSFPMPDGWRNFECCDLVELAKDLLDHLQKRKTDLLYDVNNLFNKPDPGGLGTYGGHQQMFRQTQAQLRNVIDKIDQKDDCDPPDGARSRASEPAPARPLGRSRRASSNQMTSQQYQYATSMMTSSLGFGGMVGLAGAGIAATGGGLSALPAGTAVAAPVAAPALIPAFAH